MGELVTALLLSLSLFSLFLVYLSTRIIKEQHFDLKRKETAHRQQVQELLDRIMHLGGTTWTPPPRKELDQEIEIDEETKLVLEGWREV